MSVNGHGPLLEVRELSVTFRGRSQALYAVKDVSYEVAPGEALGIVGESGSGKSVSVLAAAGLLGRTTAEVGGDVLFDGTLVSGLSSSELRQLRGRDIGFVFQNPDGSLNPVLTVGRQVSESLVVHHGLSKRQARERAADLLSLVGIPQVERRLDQYPHEFSGGMRQRVMIAAALATQPRLLIADEPTTALDVTVQAQVLDLINQLRNELDMATILISHDLGVVAGLVDRVVVMYAGRVVESGTVDEVLTDAAHPYTKGLRDSVPRLDRPRGAALQGIPGRLPDPHALRPGCEFADRCALVMDRCREQSPPLVQLSGSHQSACWLDAP